MGIKKNINLQDYKHACLFIAKKINRLSQLIKRKKLSPDEARKQAQKYIQKINPWQYVNIYEVKKTH